MSPQWHREAPDGVCTCRNGVTITSTSLGDLGIALSCGLHEVMINSDIKRTYFNYKWNCMTGDCKECAGRFPLHCKVNNDVEQMCSWNAYR